MLSILVPGIRTQNWQALYDSLVDSCEDYPFEVIFAGPYSPPDSLREVKNVKYIRDWGHQIRCQQLALTIAEGEYVHWCSDDGVALPGALKAGMEEILEYGDYALMLKYLEGDNPHPYMKENGYYLLHSNPGTRTVFIPEDWYGLNTAIAETDAVKQLGGWDCRFASCIGHADFAVRWQELIGVIHISNIVAHHVSHTPGTQGDHGPMHYAQTLEDEPLFQEIYSRPLDFNLAKLSLDNWRLADPVWKRRFN